MTGEPCTCHECCYVIPWAFTRTSWLPFGPLTRQQWGIVFDNLLPEQAAKRCVFSFAYMPNGEWVIGAMGIDQALELPVEGDA
jgi:hypothetical protein